MDNKKQNKGLIVLIVMLVIIIIGLVGYIMYDKMMVTENNDVEKKQDIINKEEPDFYDINELVKNGYIEKVETKEAELIKITTDGVFVKFSSEGEDFVKANNIEGTPSVVYSINEFSQMDRDPYNSAMHFYVLTEEGNVYYLSAKSSNVEPNFVKVNDVKVLNFYKSVDIKGLNSDLYMEYEDGNLMSIDLNEKKTYKELYNFVDVSFIPGTGAHACLGITGDKKIYAFSPEDNKFSVEVKFNNQTIYAKDIFGKIEHEVSDEIDNYGHSQYVIGQDNKLYVIIMGSANSDYNNSTIKEVKLYTEKEVAKYEVIAKNDSLYNVDIVYADNTTETISDVVVSTLYYRNK